MIREIDEKLITPDKLMSSSDMARLGCNNCKGCSDCCRDRASMITLDPWDMRMLKEGLNYSFEGLVERGYVTFTADDGVVLPALAVKPDKDECIFLDEEGKCSVHPYRPGICRMFPLARLYHEDGSFSYFLQEGECQNLNGVKIKISKWLGYPDIRGYEESVRKYHDALRIFRKRMKTVHSHEMQVKMQRMFIQKWFG